MNVVPRRYIKLATAGIALILLLLTLRWVSNHGFLDISITGSDSGVVEYIITNIHTGDKQTVSSSSPHLKKLVRSGTYEVAALQTGKSAWHQSKTTGFLQAQKLDLALKTESGRAFVGNNPAPCTYYQGGQLLSYECKGDGGITVHVPATKDTPTYTQPLANIAVHDHIIGIVRTTFGNLLITKSYDLDTDSNLQTAQLINADLTLTSQTPLSGINGDLDYSVVAYKQGFLLYTSDLTSALYFDSLQAQPSSIDLSAKHDGLHALGLQVSADRIVAYYSSVDSSDDPRPSDTVTSVLVAYSGAETKRYTVNQQISKASFCGSNICTINGTDLKSYRLDGGSLVFQYTIGDVNDIQSSGNTVFVTTSQGILTIIGSDQPDHYLYTFGAYKSCGLNSSSITPVVCLITPKQDKVALLLDEGLTDYPIDVSVSTLLKSGQFQTVSAYQNYLYLTPSVGEMSHTGSNNIHSYTSEQKDSSKKIVSGQVQAAHLDSNTYTVINTLNY